MTAQRFLGKLFQLSSAQSDQIRHRHVSPSHTRAKILSELTYHTYNMNFGKPL